MMIFSYQPDSSSHFGHLPAKMEAEDLRTSNIIRAYSKLGTTSAAL